MIIPSEDLTLEAVFVRDQVEPIHLGRRKTPTAKQGWTEESLQISQAAITCLWAIITEFEADVYVLSSHPVWSARHVMSEVGVLDKVWFVKWQDSRHDKGEVATWLGKGHDWLMIDDKPGAAAEAHLAKHGLIDRLYKPDSNLGLQPRALDWLRERWPSDGLRVA